MALNGGNITFICGITLFDLKKLEKEEERRRRRKRGKKSFFLKLKEENTVRGLFTWCGWKIRFIKRIFCNEFVYQIAEIDHFLNL